MISEKHLKTYFENRQLCLKSARPSHPAEVDSLTTHLIQQNLRLAEDILREWICANHFELSVFENPEHPRIAAYYDSGGRYEPRSHRARKLDQDYYKTKKYEVVELLGKPTNDIIYLSDTHSDEFEYTFTNRRQKELIKSSMLYCFSAEEPRALVITCNRKCALEKDPKLNVLIHAIGTAMRAEYDLGRILSGADLTGVRFDKTRGSPPGFIPVGAGAEVRSRRAKNLMNRHARSRVFLSYATANAEVVLAVDQWLRDEGVVTVVDQRDFFAGTRIRDEIMSNMARCDVIVIFYSVQAAKRPWTTFEREFADDLGMEAKQVGKRPPRIIFFNIDGTPLPNISEKNRIGINAKGKMFKKACGELYQNIFLIPRAAPDIDLEKWRNYIF